MAKKRRVRREDPERTAPNRRFSTMFRPDGKQRMPGTDSAKELNDEIGDAVRMGYSVIEEQIRQGKLAAQNLSGVPPGTGFAAGNVTDIANRLIHYSTDLAALYFDLLGALMQPSTMNGAPAATSRSDGTRVAIEIESCRNTQVTLDLWSGNRSAVLTVPALHAAESDKIPVTDVKFVPGSDEAPARIRIKVSDDQPAGLYSGLILDAESGQGCGTISLKLNE